MSVTSANVARVGVAPADAYPRYARLFAGLAELFPVSFEPRALNNLEKLRGLVLFSVDRRAALEVAAQGVPCIAIGTGTGGASRPNGTTASFQDVDVLPVCLRGLCLSEPGAGPEWPVVKPHEGEQVVAGLGGDPVWLHRPASGSHGGIDFTSLCPPALKASGFLAEYFNGGRFLSLMPLIAWLRRVAKDFDWDPPPHRACLVFDDPNLRRRWYGCIDFFALAEDAREHNYHAAIAMIPLDGDRVDPRVAALFRHRPAQLSLAIHGNNHAWLEMARPGSGEAEVSLFAQALRRVTSMERRYGLSVCRVSEAPHGVIARHLFASLTALGYEGALATTLQLLARNRGAAFPLTIGLDAAGWLDDGLCMIPRIRMAGPWKTELVLAAFLGQPIVVAGHHYDAADGLRLVHEIVDAVNRLGPVRWGNLAEIARSNYRVRRDGETLLVRMGGRLNTVPVPEGVNRIIVERQWLQGDASDRLRWRWIDGTNVQPAEAHFGMIPACRRGTVEIHSPAWRPLTPEEVDSPRPHWWPIIRRRLTESRDRVQPFLLEPARTIRDRIASRKSVS